MEVLNAGGLAPVSVHRATIFSEKKIEPKRFCSFFPSTPPLKLQKSLSFQSNLPNVAEVFSKGVNGGLAVLSTFIGAGFANALTYEEALEQSVGSSSFSDSTDFDVSGLIDSVVGFGTENPVIIAGAVTLLGIPLLLSLILKKPKSYGVESAKNTFSRLSEDAQSQLLDIRALVEFKESGSPDIRNLKKKAVSIEYKTEDESGFLKKLSLKFKDPGNTTLYILDKFDGNSELVAKIVTANGFKAAFVIKDGAEGPRGWKNSGLPWLLPKKALKVDFGDLADVISTALGEGSEGLPVLGVAAAAGFGILAFSEVETILQLLGSAALIQFATKKLLFAQDRKVTLQQIDEFLTTKVAPKEFVDELKMIGKALLPAYSNGKALPAPSVEENPATTIVLAQPQPEAPPESSEATPEPAPMPAPETSSVSQSEVKEEIYLGNSRPLSPYPYYPDFKPPSSPSPSKP